MTPLLAAFQNVPLSQDSPNSEIRTAESTTPNENISQRHQSLGYLFKQPSRMSFSGNSTSNTNKIPTETEMLLRRLSTKPGKPLIDQGGPSIKALQKIEEENNLAENNQTFPNGVEISSSNIRSRNSVVASAVNDSGLVRRVHANQRVSVIKMLQDIDYSDSAKDLNARRTILVSNHHVSHHAESDQSVPDHLQGKNEGGNKSNHLPDSYRRNHDALQQSIHSTIAHENNATSLSPRSSMNGGRKPRRNSITVQAPQNTLSTIDKFKLHKVEQCAKKQSKVTADVNNSKHLSVFHYMCSYLSCCNGLLRGEGGSKSPAQKVGDDIEGGKCVENSLESMHINEDFSEIYILGQPIYFFRYRLIFLLYLSSPKLFQGC